MNVLAIGCHPDDLEIGCGGTLARYVKNGHKVFMCHVANGNLGHAEIIPDELRKIRAEEAENACKIIGAEKLFNVDVGDLSVDSNNKEAFEEVIRIIRFAKPDLIITHNPDDYMQDHMETFKIVFNASFASSIPHLVRGEAPYNKIVPIFHMDTFAGIGFIPTEYVDITGEIEQKLQALNCHQSQIKWMKEHDGIDFLDFVRTCSKYRGQQCGAPYAEGFRQYNVWPRIDTKRFLP